MGTSPFVVAVVVVGSMYFVEKFNYQNVAIKIAVKYQYGISNLFSIRRAQLFHNFSHYEQSLFIFCDFLPIYALFSC